jgi:hypothetical protein
MFHTMIAFKKFLEERVISSGFNPNQEHLREKHRQEIHDILKKSYSHPSLGGYGGLGSGTEEESKSIHDDISGSLIKAIKRDGKITAVNLYKDKYGRKAIASGTDGSIQGKKDYKKLFMDDNSQKRAWAEVSGAPEHILSKMGMPKISSDKAAELTGKEIKKVNDDEHHYIRKIGHSDHEKIIMGHPKYS